MSRLAVVWLAIGGAWMAAAGCKSEELESEPVSVDRFAATFAKAQCDNVALCCERSAFAFDQTNCEGRLRASFQAQLDQILMWPVDYDAAAAGRCLAALHDPQHCGDSALEFPSCKGLFAGTLEDEQPCPNDLACKSRWCTQRGEASEAVCTVLDGSGPQVAGKAGDDCSDTCASPVDCFAFGSAATPTVCYRSDGLYCSSTLDGSTSRCERVREVGEACEVTDECAAGSFCQGICQAPHPNGAACEYDSECRSEVCVDGECVDSAFSEATCASGGTDF